MSLPQSMRVGYVLKMYARFSETLIRQYLPKTYGLAAAWVRCVCGGLDRQQFTCDTVGPGLPEADLSATRLRDVFVGGESASESVQEVA